MMMAFKASTYACLLLVVVGAASLRVVVADANTVPSRWCINTPEPEFCEEMVNGAYSAFQATSCAIKMTIKKTKFAIKVIKKFISELPEELDQNLKAHVIETCKKDFQDTLDSYVSALFDLDSGEVEKLKAAMNIPPLDTCVTELSDLVINPGVITRVMEKTVKYGKYAAFVADNLKPPFKP